MHISGVQELFWVLSPKILSKANLPLISKYTGVQANLFIKFMEVIYIFKNQISENFH